ncbi:MAG: tRNA (N(6)-L-threonylcarbamoyladenosine(37)-C(2))-methylthiotransferase MtaB [Nitrospinae bacterium]|nr:tRNA (N(6)-L-threonylcarbamoyladenosine(37)-C(2))-methylthiotransferase MtaB [Nitrospinota bacterium]
MTAKGLFAVETLGCRFNRYETAEIDYELERAGYVRAAVGQTPDLVVINTCTVTDRSDYQCRAAIRKVKERHPDALVVVAGCYAETNPAEVAAMGEVDLILGNAEKFDVALQVARLDRGRKSPLVAVGAQADGALPVRGVERLEGRTNAYLNIQSGCDEVCAFCVVRLARGKNRSADPDQVVAQVGRMADAGVKELVLAGINLGDYGKGGGPPFAFLVERILRETKIPRIRFSSLNPNTIEPALIDLMAADSRLMPHLHIPLQSGCDATLARMRRPYTTDDYERLVERIVAALPAVGLGADVLTSFPGETEEEFETTRQFIERLPFTTLHVFTFSPREGTEAWAMKVGGVPKDEARRRTGALKTIASGKNHAARKAAVGAVVPVLVETRRDREGMLRGFTPTYLPVTITGDDRLKGEIAPVRIVAAGESRLLGEATP